jgi:putative phosphoesterase
MRVAALYDIHGNLPALEAVLKEIEQERVDQIVVGGDVLPGPMPCETLTALQNLTIPIQFISGNGEAAVLAERAGADVKLPEQAREAVHWNAQQLSPEDQVFIAAWPKTLRLNIPGLGEVLFCHGTPRSDTEIFTQRTAEDRLIPIFEEPAVSVVICGHTHMQFERTIGKVRVINAGSVGMPFGEPGAYWLLLGPDVQLRRTNYDLNKAAKRIRQTNYPQAESFAAHNVLQPPSEEQMLELFSRAELK